MHSAISLLLQCLAETYPMSKNCVARNCKNQAMGGDSYKTALCVKCKKDTASNTPLYLTCQVCGESIFIQNKSSGVRITCSQKCKLKRAAIKNKEQYRKAHPIKNKQCKLCKKDFTKEQLDRSKRTFCSKKCYYADRYINIKLEKYYKAKTKLIKLQLKWK